MPRALHGLNRRGPCFTHGPEGGGAVSLLEVHQEGSAVKSEVVVSRIPPIRGRNRLFSKTGRCQDQSKSDEDEGNGKETGGNAHGGSP